MHLSVLQSSQFQFVYIQTGQYLFSKRIYDIHVSENTQVFLQILSKLCCNTFWFSQKFLKGGAWLIQREYFVLGVEKRISQLLLIHEILFFPETW